MYLWMNNSVAQDSVWVGNSFFIMVYLTRMEHFNAAHKLYNPSWSKEKNDEVFGKCANDNWHGHNYDLYVTVKGEPDVDTGFLFDVKKLSVIIKEHVIEKVDHRNLNVDVDKVMCSNYVSPMFLLWFKKKLSSSRHTKIWNAPLWKSSEFNFVIWKYGWKSICFQKGTF